jgi:hypothetical protein
MAKSAVINDDRAASADTSNALFAPGAAGVTTSSAQDTDSQTATAPAADANVPTSGDSDAPSASFANDQQTGREVTTAPSSPQSAPSNPAPASSNSTAMSADDLERAKSIAKLKILDWVRQQTRDDPASLALRMPYLQSRLKAWEDAKASGDAGRMTKAYNDLLRGLEAEQNRRGIPKDQQRVLPNEMAEDVARGILNAEPAKMLDKLGAAKDDHGDYANGMMKQISAFLPDALKLADAQTSKLAGELLWRRSVATPPSTNFSLVSSDHSPTALSGSRSASIAQTPNESYDQRSSKPAPLGGMRGGAYPHPEPPRRINSGMRLAKSGRVGRVCQNGQCRKGVDAGEIDDYVPPAIRAFEQRVAAKLWPAGGWGPEHSEFHQYYQETRIYAPHRTMAEVMRMVQTWPAPQSSYERPQHSGPVRPGDTSWVSSTPQVDLMFGERTYLPGGYVSHDVDGYTGAVANITTGNHILVPGFIIRWVEDRGDGSFVIHTLGAGMGLGQYFNETLGPRLFSDMDNALAQKLGGTIVPGVIKDDYWDW